MQDDRLPVVALTLGSLALYTGVWLASAYAAGVTPSVMGVYYDGYLYVEIAKSFPLPFSPEGPHYLGQAPLYPAVMYLGRVLSGFSADWGTLAMLATVVPAALCAPVFFRICRALDVAPLWPTLLFICANPRWIANAATPHTEPLVMLLALLCLLAYLRGRLWGSVAWLALAGLTRFPAFLLGAPLALGWLAVRRAWTWRTFAALALPPLAFAAHNAYLYATVPDFGGIAEAHRIFWPTQLTWPFAAWLVPMPRESPHFAATYLTLGTYLAALVTGLVARAREWPVLTTWIAILVGFHVSLSGSIGVAAFTRFALLCWPAALLILWQAGARRLPSGFLAGAGALLLLYAVQYPIRHMPTVVERQDREMPFLQNVIARLALDDGPRWVDFRVLRRMRRANPGWFAP